MEDFVGDEEEDGGHYGDGARDGVRTWPRLVSSRPADDTPARPADVRRYFNGLSDRNVGEILAGKPTVCELAEAASWLARRHGRAKAQGMAAILEFALGEGNWGIWRVS